MNLSNVNQATEWFQVLQTTDRSQAAVMRLEPGKATGKNAESHEDSEQLLLLMEGVLAAEIGSECFPMNTGDMVIIPAGVNHKFTNSGATVAVTFNTYCPIRPRKRDRDSTATAASGLASPAKFPKPRHLHFR
jgi:mannose-6-phosphate isomerase-like protein (cupin superfamily)